MPDGAPRSALAGNGLSEAANRALEELLRALARDHARAQHRAQLAAERQERGDE